MAEFQIECFQNEFLPQDGDVMHAVLTVSVSGDRCRRWTPGWLTAGQSS